jgi:hypothetical protein
MKALIGTVLLSLLAIPAALAYGDGQRRMASLDEMAATAKHRARARLAQERPFGGPLPPLRRRSIDRKPMGTVCKTPTVACKLQKVRPVGDPCSCSGTGGKPVEGTVVEHP